MNNDLIFNIHDIFDSNKENKNSCLVQNECSMFYIAPYQRGYKWGEYHNSLLFNDLLSAYESSQNNQKKSEYYLQYITVKKKRHYLEVIDGQQRLTTLTILLSIFGCDISIAKAKLYYEVRRKVQEFINEFIYKSSDAFENDWNSFISEYPKYDEQDIFYLFKARRLFANKIQKLDAEKQNKFKKYIEESVKIIVNLVEPHISSEQIFANLNTNKIPLTNEELVKGLFLTKLARESKNGRSFKEILELRASVGREWDEMENWLNRPDVKNFYFKNKSGLFGLLELFCKQENITIHEGQGYYLYDAINMKIKNGSLANGLFNNLKLYYSILKNWYENEEIYNLLGYLLYVKKIVGLDKLLLKSKKTLIKDLKRVRNEFLSDKEIEDLNYTNQGDKKQFEYVLLALSVFYNEVLEIDNMQKFNFYLYRKEHWSLEHIFPQHPDNIPKELTEKDIINIAKLKKENISLEDILNENSFKNTSEEDIKKCKKNINNILSKKVKSANLSKLDKEVLSEVLKNNNLHKIGNMALLSRSDNSSMSNSMFNEKRLNLIKRISNGSFVPKHTFDVFSKLLSKNMNPNLELWTNTDIDEHQLWVVNKIVKLLEDGK